MSNTSSRILQNGDLSAVTPMAWRSTETPPPAPRPARAPAVNAGNSDDSDAARKESYQRGFSEGRNIGHEQALAEIQPVMDPFRARWPTWLPCVRAYARPPNQICSN